MMKSNLFNPDIIKRLTSSIAIVLLLAFATAVSASDGKALYVAGNAILIDQSGKQLQMVKGTDVSSGDTIITHDRTVVQIKMSDGGLLAVRANSEFKITNYTYNKDVKKDKSHFALVRGGFRSITGKIGQLNKKAYRLTSPVATIGIRGTDYSATYCDGQCETVENGLHVTVYSGGITVSNDGGSVDVNPGEFAYVQDENTAPAMETATEDTSALFFSQADTQKDATQSVPETLVEADISTAKTSPVYSVAMVDKTTGGTQLVEVSAEQAISMGTWVAGSTVKDVNNSTQTLANDNFWISNSINPEIIASATGTHTYVSNFDQASDGFNNDLTGGVYATVTAYFDTAQASAHVEVTNGSYVASADTGLVGIDANGQFAGTLTDAGSTGISVIDGSLVGSFSGNAATDSTGTAPSDANIAFGMNTSSAGIVTGTANLTLQP